MIHRKPYDTEIDTDGNAEWIGADRLLTLYLTHFCFVCICLHNMTDISHAEK